MAEGTQRHRKGICKRGINLLPEILLARLGKKSKRLIISLSISTLISSFQVWPIE